MKALLLNEYGDPPDVTVGDISDPVASSDQVLIRVHAAGLNPIDHKLARGWMRAVMDFEPPVVLGWDVAGTIAGLGPGVTSFAVGQRVFGCLGPPTGTAAELVVADVQGPWLAALPTAMPATLAATLPMVGLTAHTVARALTREGTVLVIGAGGGVGAFLVPLLSRTGIAVWATASGDDGDRLTAAGAHSVLDHRAADVGALVHERAPRGVDAVIDLVNQFDALRESAEMLRPGGQLLSTLFGPDPADFPRRDIELTYVRNDPQIGDLERVASLVADGIVTPVPVHPHPLMDAAAAFSRLADGGVHGKLVLELVADAGTAAPSPALEPEAAA